ncbi:nucleotide-binding protein [Streptomyces sp. NBC_01304]|uniref:nucleotide-binding protein n=1 Tax=Streptomyces sp. NBC_01304 TaxID=2903818 RepID=UPI003FA3D7B5
MAAPHKSLRARLRTQLTGETLQQAQIDLAGRDGVPDPAHEEQAALEAAVLHELDQSFARDHLPTEDHLYGLVRVRPRHDGLVLDLVEELWEGILDQLLPDLLPDLDIMTGIPGLRARTLGRGRIELHRPGTPASITLQLHGDDAVDAKAWVGELPSSGHPLRTMADWTDTERERLGDYARAIGEPMSRSRVLRRIMAFRHLPNVFLLDDTDTGTVPTAADFQQLLAVRKRPRTPATPVRAKQVRPLTPVAGRPLVVAVVSGHGPRGNGAGGHGRTTVTIELGRALAARGRRVLVVDGNPQGDATHYLQNAPEGLRVEPATQRSTFTMDVALARDLAHTADADVVLLDVGPTDQLQAVDIADHWLAVANMAQSPHGDFVMDETRDAKGRLLAGGWHEHWLTEMRAHRWDVRWRLAPRAFGRMFAPFPASTCAGVVVLGERTIPGAQAVDYLDGLTSDLPLLTPPIPHSRRDLTDPPTGAERTAYEAIARNLLG